MRHEWFNFLGSRMSFCRFISTVCIGAGLSMVLAGVAFADELEILSAGAIEPGLKAAAGAFEKQTGHVINITFNTAPELKKRMDRNPAFDVMIAPPAVISDFAAAGKLATARAALGRVGLGVAVRDSAPVPDVSTAEAFKASVMAADSLVFNRASTGLYLENLLKKMDSYAQTESKTTRYPDGASVLEHVIRGRGREVGFAAMTEILLYTSKGLTLVGPLPAAIQNYTSYTAAPLASGANQALAQEFVSFLSEPAAKTLFVAAGITD